MALLHVVAIIKHLDDTSSADSGAHHTRGESFGHLVGKPLGAPVGFGGCFMKKTYCQWPFQEPKLERISPENMALYGTVPPF